MSTAKENAYRETRSLPWGKPSRADWAVKKVAKYISQVGNANALAGQIRSLAATGLSGAKLKKPFLKTLRAWKSAKIGSPKEHVQQAVQNIADVANVATDKVVDFVNTPTGQAAINAALLAAGLPPLVFGADTTTDDTLAQWGAQVSTPEPTDDDPELADEKKSSSKAGWLAGGVAALLALPRLWK